MNDTLILWGRCERAPESTGLVVCIWHCWFPGSQRSLCGGRLELPELRVASPVFEPELREATESRRNAHRYTYKDDRVCLTCLSHKRARDVMDKAQADPAWEHGHAGLGEVPYVVAIYRKTSRTNTPRGVPLWVGKAHGTSAAEASKSAVAMYCNQEQSFHAEGYVVAVRPVEITHEVFDRRYLPVEHPLETFHVSPAVRCTSTRIN